MSCGESRRRNVEVDCLGIGPDPSSLRPIDVLDYFVLNVSEDMAAMFIFGLADLGGDFDQERVVLATESDHIQLK